MRKELTYSPFAALAMAAQRLAQKYDDPELGQGAKKLEAVAQDEINKQKADQKKRANPGRRAAALRPRVCDLTALPVRGYP
jgi:hypothetical protein